MAPRIWRTKKTKLTSQLNSLPVSPPTFSVITGVLQGIESMTSCPGMDPAGTASGVHKSGRHNNSLTSIHFLSPCAIYPHHSLWLFGKKQERSFFFPLQKLNFVLYLWGVCVLSPIPSDALRALKVSSIWKKNKAPPGSIHLPSLPANQYLGGVSYGQTDSTQTISCICTTTERAM